MKTNQGELAWRNSDWYKIFAGQPPWTWGAFIIIAATLAAYWPVFSAGFIWDDDAYVTENPLLTAPDGLSRIWFSAHSQSQYFPLVFTTLRFEHALWGLNPIGYHIVNVVLHIVNALLVWRLLGRLKLRFAWLAAAVFALHPVQVETVAWVTELKNTESTLFYLLAVFAWLKFCEGRGRWFYTLALMLHLLALLAKTTACTLPAVLLLVLWIQGRPVTWRRVAGTIPFLLLGCGMGLLSVWWENHLGNYQPRYHLLGGPVDRLLIATHAVWFYAQKIFWPLNLTFSYPRWQINPQDWRQYLWLAGCLAVLPVLWFGRHKLGRLPVAAIAFFVAVLSPMLGFIPLYTFYYSYVADHYQYFACLGIILLGLGIAEWFFQKAGPPAGLLSALSVAMLLALSILTWRQCHIYKDLMTLWTDTLKKNPQSWMAHTNLGRLCAQQKDYDTAEWHYLAAFQINPQEESILYNLGNMLARVGRLDEAVLRYRQAIEIAPNKAEAHNNLGVVLNRQHLTDEAILEYQQAIHYKPDYPDAYFNLGNALSAQHKMDEAVAAYQQAYRLAPDSEAIRKRLAALTAQMNSTNTKTNQ